MQTKGTPPRFKFKVGRVNASVWQNGEHWNTTFTVSYKDDKDKWSETNSFSRNDLPALSSAAQFAVSMILGHELKGKGENQEEPPF